MTLLCHPDDVDRVSVYSLLVAIEERIDPPKIKVDKFVAPGTILIIDLPGW